MLSRLAAICITGFWLAMTGLLVVRELYPESTRLNAVPLGYVGQVVFQHGQSSDLRIFAPPKDILGSPAEIGFLHVQPSFAADTGRHVIEFNGSAKFTLPNGRNQHLSWAASFEMSVEFAPVRLHLDLSTPEPVQHSDIVVDFAGKKAAFGTKVGDRIVNEIGFTLDDAGFSSLMSRAGVDPTMIQQLRASQQEMPRFELSAQSSSFAIDGQKLETFLLSLKVGGQGVFDVQLSQLGQVLSAQVPALGWKLTPFNLTR
jgi:hypothetical protein